MHMISLLCTPASQNHLRSHALLRQHDMTFTRGHVIDAPGINDPTLLVAATIVFPLLGVQPDAP